jgi:hypothetical protein
VQRALVVGVGRLWLAERAPGGRVDVGPVGPGVGERGDVEAVCRVAGVVERLDRDRDGGRTLREVRARDVDRRADHVDRGSRDGVH